MNFQFDPSFGARPLRMEGDVSIDFDQIESFLKIILPYQLVDILREFQSAVVFDGQVEFSARNCTYSDNRGMIGLSVVYGAVEGPLGIMKINRQIFSQIPEDYVAFAGVGMGNHLLIDRNNYSVAVWLHDEALSYRAITTIYDSFSDFLDSLVVVQPQPLPSLEDLGLDLKAMGIEGD